MEVAIREESGAFVRFKAMPEVWSIEMQDIRNQFAGNHDENLQRQLENAGSTFGIKKEYLAGVASLIPGGSAVAMLGAAAVSMTDLSGKVAVQEAADRTEQLLAAVSLRLEQVDWDIAERMVAHISSWLAPRLQQRHAALVEVQKLSGGNSEVQHRIDLYAAALHECRSAQEAFAARLAEHLSASRATQQRHREYEEAAARSASEVKVAVESSVKALLIDRESADVKLAASEASYAQLRCSHSSFLQACERLALPGEKLCPDHKCANPECHSPVLKSSHYCASHQLTLRTSRTGKTALELSRELDGLPISDTSERKGTSYQSSPSDTGGGSMFPWILGSLIAIALMFVVFGPKT